MNVSTDQLYDLELAQPYNGFYGNPIPDDASPRDYDRAYNWNGQWAGDFDWLDDHEWNNATKKFYYLPDGGRNIWETTVPPEIYEGGHYPWDPTGEDWFFRCNSLRSDFFTDEEIRGKVVIKMTDITRPSTKDWAGDQSHIAIINIEQVDDYALLDVYFNFTETTNPIDSGWQIVSVPVEVENYSANSVFPTHVGYIYGYEGGSYVIKDTLKNGPGYWTKFNADQTKTHSGLIIDSLSIPVPNGWSFLGSITYDVMAADLCTEPAGIISYLYRYDPVYGYLLMNDGDRIKPGIGYWLKTKQSGSVIMSESCGMQKVTVSPEIDLAELDKFIITDSNGKQQSLYVANTDIDTTLRNINFILPPPMPELSFDARFNYEEFIKGVSVDSGFVDLEINVETTAYPITLSWEINPENGIEYSFISDSGPGKITQISFVNGQTEVSKNSQGQIHLFGKVSDGFKLIQIPNHFELLQNYPNPFNPTTTIKYSLPSDELVSLNVYDAVGQKITELVNEELKAGYYEVSFDASSLSSGVYFYQIIAGRYVAAKKMIILK